MLRHVVKGPIGWVVVFGVLAVFSLTAVRGETHSGKPTQMAEMKAVVKKLNFKQANYVVLGLNGGGSVVRLACPSTRGQFNSAEKRANGHSGVSKAVVRVGNHSVHLLVRNGSFSTRNLTCQREHIVLATSHSWLALLLSDGNLS